MIVNNKMVGPSFYYLLKGLCQAFSVDKNTTVKTVFLCQFLLDNRFSICYSAVVADAKQQRNAVFLKG
jgi:hypothetical protein